MNGIVVGLDVLPFFDRTDNGAEQGMTSPESLRSPWMHQRRMREESMTEGRRSLASGREGSGGQGK